MRTLLLRAAAACGVASVTGTFGFFATKRAFRECRRWYPGIEEHSLRAAEQLEQIEALWGRCIAFKRA